MKPAESPPPVQRSGAAKVKSRFPVAAWQVAPLISTQALQTLDRLLRERRPFQLLARSSGACVFAARLHSLTAAGHSGTTGFPDHLPGTHPPRLTEKHRQCLFFCFPTCDLYIFGAHVYQAMFFFYIYKSQLEYLSLKTDKA